MTLGSEQATALAPRVIGPRVSGIRLPTNRGLRRPSGWGLVGMRVGCALVAGRG